ncbi:MAG: protein kinase domain-containing protein [Nanobdellota archaeon]
MDGADRFSPDDLVQFDKEKISSETVMSYPRLFTGLEIVMLQHKKISGEQVQRYDERLDAFDIIELEDLQTEPYQTKRFGPHFNSKSIVYLLTQGISPEFANTVPRYPQPHGTIRYVNSRQSPYRKEKHNITQDRIIESMQRYGIMPAQLIGLGKNQDLDEIIFLVSKGMGIDEIQGHRFSGSELVHLLQQDIDPSYAKGFPSDFDVYMIEEFVQNRIGPEIAEFYRSFRTDEIQGCTDAGSSLYDASSSIGMRDTGMSHQTRGIPPTWFYPEGLDDYTLEICISRGIVPEDFLVYDSDIDPNCLTQAILRGVSNEQLIQYNTRFLTEDFCIEAVPPAIANEYPEGLSNDAVNLLFREGVLPWRIDEKGLHAYLETFVEAHHINHRFRQKDITFGFYMLNESIINGLITGMNTDLKEYISSHHHIDFHEFLNQSKGQIRNYSLKASSQLDGWQGLVPQGIADQLERYGFNYHDFKRSDLQRMRPQLITLSHFMAWNELESPSYFSMGGQGIVLRSAKGLWKLGPGSLEEMELLSLVDSEYVVRIEQGVWGDYPVDDMFDISHEFNTALIGFEMEYITGETLEESIEKGPVDTILKYSRDILQGMIDLRLAGIYHHRDLRPANIMYDSTKDCMVIIDLGIASTERRFDPKHNRGYGGSSDLQSLAQIMYKMYTGKHLFAYSPEMEQTLMRDEIKTERDWVFEKPEERLDFYFEVIDTEIDDKKGRDIIKECLIAKPYHYARIRRLFDREER